MATQRVKRRLPQPSIGPKPGFQLLQRSRVQAVDPLLGGRAARYEATLSEHLEMFGDRGLTKTEALHELVHARGTLTQQGENLSTPRFRHCGEDVGTHALNMPADVYTCQGIC